MKVIVTENTVQSVINTENAWMLHQLFAYACHGRHLLLFDPPEAINSWLGTIDSGSQAAYKNAIALSARDAVFSANNAATVIVDSTASPSWKDPIAQVPIQDALDLLSEPLGVLVENSENDWHFLCGIMNQSERDRMMRFVSKGWAVPLHGGGSNLVDQLKRRLNDNKKMLRTFVLFDSDRLHPDELEANWTPVRPGHRPASCQAFKWESMLKQIMPYRYWMLRRRFIESYMPHTELAAGCSENIDQGAVTAFVRMSQDQQWYFNMKTGFEGDSKRHDNYRSGGLYSQVTQNDRLVLQKGFGGQLANHYKNSVANSFRWDVEARSEASAPLNNIMRLL